MKEKLKAFQTEINGVRKDLKGDADLIKYLDKNPHLKGMAKNLMLFYFNEAIRGCNNCFIDATIRLLGINLDSELANKEDCVFHLCNGALLRDTETHKQSLLVSQFNLTFENAIWHLKQNPSKIKYFDKFPENWKELIQEPIEETEVIVPIQEETNAEVIVEDKPKRGRKSTK